MKQSNDHPWREYPPSPGKPVGLGPPEIKVEVLQAAFTKSGLSKGEVARRMGWKKEVANVHRVNVVLGLEPNTSTGKKQKRVTYKMAVRLAKAMDASPVEMGI